MSWKDAYEHQIDLWAFWQSEIGQGYAEGYCHDKGMKGSSAVDMPSELVRIESEKLLAADPIYVDDDMETLWEAAADKFQPEPFEASDLLTPAGFVFLPRPQMMTDVNGKRCSWRAFSWAYTTVVEKDEGRQRPAIGISLYSHIDDDDDFNPDLREAAWDPKTNQSRMAGWPLSLMHIDFWPFGESFEEVHGGGSSGRLTDEEEARAREGFTDTWRRIQSLFRLMQQEITVPTQERPPRASRRRGGRKANEFEPKTVTVIRLRRPKRARQSEDVKEVDWSHRWPVSAHWRNQWFPSLGIHRQILIGTYIKGPEDKPLRIPEKRAFELVQ